MPFGVALVLALSPPLAPFFHSIETLSEAKHHPFG